MGILQKKKPHLILGISPHTPSYHFLLPSQYEIDPYTPKNVLDLAIRKSKITEEIWNILQLFSSGVVFLSNVAKYYKCSPMKSSFEGNAYI